MLIRLLHREIGVESSRVLRRLEVARRTYSIALATNKEIISDHTGPILSLDVDLSDQKFLLAGSSDSVISCYDLDEPVGEQKIVHKSIFSTANVKGGHTYGVSTLVWSPHDTGMFMSGSYDGKVIVWDTNNLVPAAFFPIERLIYSIHLSPISHHPLIAVAATGNTEQTRLIDLVSGSSTHTLFGHKDSVLCVRWSPADEHLLATASTDRTIKFWDIRKSKNCLFTLDQFNSQRTDSNSTNNAHNTGGHKGYTVTSHEGAITALCFTPNGEYLLSTGGDNRLRLWDAYEGKNTLVTYPEIKNRFQKGTQICVSNNGSIVYHHNGNSILAYEIFSGKKINALTAHYDTVNCCTFHPQREELYSGASDRQILCWTPSISYSQQEDTAPQKKPQPNKKDDEEDWVSDED